ncbi:MAG: GLUG motif-containing protein [Ruminococcus sp.]
MKTKKLLSVILCLVITISSLSFATVSASAAEITPVTPGKDGNGVYQIGTAEELYGFAQLVNSGNPSASAVVTADITVNTGVLKADGNLADDTSGFTSWTPIGYWNSSTDYVYYSGKFDGQGHTISGLYFNNTSTRYVGLFGCLAENGEIKNVGVIDSYFRGQEHIGGVCGVNDGGTITSCYSAGKVSGTGNYVGGVCGSNQHSSTITGCYNTGTVSGSSDVGGVCGHISYSEIIGCYNTGTVSGSSDVGGVCGENYLSEIIGCYNTGTVSGSYYVGGVCGENSGPITGSYNTGTVSGTGSSSKYIGGVCGENWNKITGSYNAGTVSGDERVGGVCGFNFGGTIIGSYNTGEVTDDYSSDYSGTTLDIFVGGVCGVNNDGTITGCYNTGEVTGKVSGTVTGTVNIYDGGVCGYNTNRGTITGCYTNNGGMCGVDNGTVTACAEYTGNEFKDGTVCALLNKAIGGSYDVTFYQGEEIPVFLSKISYQYCTVNYAVAPTYTVTIPETVTLGQTATIKAEDVILEEEKQLKVKLTGTSGENNAFKVKSAEGAELEYTVNDGTKDISIDETVLTVNPDNSANGSATLKFNAPSDSDIIYAGKYTGTVTFTVSVADTQNS